MCRPSFDNTGVNPTAPIVLATLNARYAYASLGLRYLTQEKGLNVELVRARLETDYRASGVSGAGGKPRALFEQAGQRSAPGSALARRQKQSLQAWRARHAGSQDMQKVE